MRSSARKAGCVLLHRYLNISAVTWDLLDPTQMITRDQRPIPSHTLFEPATNPPLAFVTITSPYIPWTIEVNASHRPYLTLGDIFNGIYHSLHTQITWSEFNLLPSRNAQRRATRAYEWRYRRQQSARVYKHEKRGGMKRIDFLLEHSRFIGISNTCCQPDKWQLNVTWC
ncbi:hypothetical protein GALMADRAFT_79446 [Galerina marginata CBS 339.88]|uniref:DUF6699 domain-containing protein n=1 Tax=Galerina marginata (strain CBS 339.88) TaxID=685588 RepID=A0A067SA83_GALM3|nr:hypothetical protein GALMADRAFT_79446 [Galerina marginata CBS 339.88]